MNKNKNYIKSLINEMFDQNILNSEDDRSYMKSLICTPILTGNFEEDLEYLKALWEEEKPQPVVEENVFVEEDGPTQDIEEIVNGLQIGFNFVPGIGVGYCSDKKDLERMKDFIRGGMAVRKLIESMFGF